MFQTKVRTKTASLVERRFRQRQRQGKASSSPLGHCLQHCNLRVMFLTAMVFILTVEVVMLLNTSMPTYIPASASDPRGIKPVHSHSRLRVDINGEVDFPVRSSRERELELELQDGDEPQLVRLMDRLREQLAPMQMSYIRGQAVKAGKQLPACLTRWEVHKDTFLPGCPRGGCTPFATLEEAKRACVDSTECAGIVQAVKGGEFELRSQRFPSPSKSGETAFVKVEDCARDPTALNVWKAFSEAMSAALEDDSLNLDTSYGPPRKDNSIYLSIASYRDNTCPATLRMAFERAKNPEKLFVGIVQQNCLENCMTGTGWGRTRRWVPGDPDVDCAEEFCTGDGKEYCDNGQVRILRLEEIQAYGPFFSRYLNSKLWRGETFYMQIDAHTEFREHWDFSVIQQMRATPTYPFSVISNYPPSGSPKNKRMWSAPDGIPRRPPSALCGCSFEGAGGRHKTVRLMEIGRTFANDATPRHNAFVAAGFFIAHGSIVDNVPFDPFMPFLFMGEEIALSVRFWTHGYDIYAPAVDVLRHEYVRKEHPKFWESVTMVFSNGGIHNALTDLIIPRVQYLLNFADEKDLEDNNNVFIRAEEYSTGRERTVDQFTEHVGLDVKNLRQKVPDWCRNGEKFG